MQTAEQSTRREIVNDLATRKIWQLASGLAAPVDEVAHFQGGALVELSLRAAGGPSSAALRAGALRNFGAVIAALVSSALLAIHAGEARLDQADVAVRCETSLMGSVGIAGENSLARIRNVRGRDR